MSGLRIVIASGKGGTGKTTLATNLAVSLADTGRPTAYIDCDVEEPNGHIFLRPTISTRREVSIPVPEVDMTRCTLCGACGKACRYSAILMLPKRVLTFPKLCHGCGGCTLACPSLAIREVPRVIGVVEEGLAGAVLFRQGRLDVGEAMAPPVIRAVLASAPEKRVAAGQAVLAQERAKRASRNCTIVIDAPPGTSCPVIESVKSADVVLLVTEPTPFGLNDLKLAVEMVRELDVPFAVAINRAGSGDEAVLEYCATEQIAVLLEIADDRQIAEAYSRGELAVYALPQLKPRFVALYDELCELARRPLSPRPPKEAACHAVSASRPEQLPSQQTQPADHGALPELVVISGKGGTGKTSIVASFFALAEQAGVADCDVDAADLHLVLDPTVRELRPFSGGKTAVIDPELCQGCGLCAEHCRFEAIAPATQAMAAPQVDAVSPPSRLENLSYHIDALSCEGCGVCVDHCPEHAIDFESTARGEWYVSDTRRGPMVHAQLGIAQENSGKLVSLVRREAKAVLQSQQRDLLICDGSPGIGCPVIASIAGASLVLVVTEPTLSGLHDLRRVVELCQQFRVRAALCINKADINAKVAAEIEAVAARANVPLLGRVRYDEAVTKAQVKRLSVVEYGDGKAASDVRALWKRVVDAMA